MRLCLPRNGAFRVCKPACLMGEQRERVRESERDPPLARSEVGGAEVRRQSCRPIRAQPRCLCIPKYIYGGPLCWAPHRMYCGAIPLHPSPHPPYPFYVQVSLANTIIIIITFDYNRLEREFCVFCVKYRSVSSELFNQPTQTPPRPSSREQKDQPTTQIYTLLSVTRAERDN